MSMNNNEDSMETRRRKVAHGADVHDDAATNSAVPNGDFKTENVAPAKFPCAWTCSVMLSCLFLTVVFMPFLAFNLPRDPRDDLPWWQKAAVYQIKTREFHDSNKDGVGDIKGITKGVDHLQWLGVAAVLLDSIFVQAGEDVAGVTNFYEVDSKLGTIADIKDLIDTLHKNNIQVVLDLEINHSHQKHSWFESSRSGESKYKDYYVWRNGKTGSDGRLQPPNNWLSVTGGSAWSFDDARQQYYLHQFHHSLPDLNFHNPAVIEEVKNIMKFWLEKGVDGFLISHADYLIETPEVTLNEPRSCNHDALPVDYSYLLHPYTRQVPYVHNLTKQWRDILDQYQSPNRQLLLLLDSWPSAEGEDLKTWNQHNQGKTQLALNYALSQTLTQQVPCGGNCLARHVSEIRDLGAVDAMFTWTALLNRSVSHDFGDYASVYNILILLLPGTPVVQAGQETAHCHQRTYQSIKEANACQHSVNLFQELLDLRQEPAFLWGRLEFAVQHDNIFSFFRYAKGWSYTKYLVTVNVGSEVSNDSYVNSSPLVKCPAQATIAKATKPHRDRVNSVKSGDRVSLNNLQLYPGEGLVIALK